MTRALILIVVLIFLPISGSADEYILRSSLDQDIGRVDVPFSLALRFYYDTCCIRAPEFSKLEVPGADVTRSDTPEQYEDEINGVKFGVYLIRYTITPRRIGPLDIPKITMTGEVVNPSRVFSPSDPTSPKIEVEAEPLSIQVLP